MSRSRGAKKVENFLHTLYYHILCYAFFANAKKLSKQPKIFVLQIAEIPYLAAATLPSNFLPLKRVKVTIFDRFEKAKQKCRSRISKPLVSSYFQLLEPTSYTPHLFWDCSDSLQPRWEPNEKRETHFLLN